MKFAPSLSAALPLMRTAGNGTYLRRWLASSDRVAPGAGRQSAVAAGAGGRWRWLAGGGAGAGGAGRTAAGTGCWRRWLRATGMIEDAAAVAARAAEAGERAAGKVGARM